MQRRCVGHGFGERRHGVLRTVAFDDKAISFLATKIGDHEGRTRTQELKACDFSFTENRRRTIINHQCEGP